MSVPTPHPVPGRDLAIVLVAYIAATAAAILPLRLWILPAMPTLHPIWVLAIATGLATAVVFAFSRVLDNSSVYDPYWSVMPPAAAVYFGWGVEHGGDPVRRWLVTLLVFAWGLRLTFNWMRGWTGFAHEDWRYVDFRAQWGRFYWLGSFAGIHLFPTVCTFVGSLAMWPAIASTRPVGALDVIATLVTAAAILIESVADEQLRAFRKDPRNTGKICDVGLWSVSRHPNYFGEISLWFGLFLFAVAADFGAWWTVIGPLWMIGLFAFASIPLADARSCRRRPEYAAHMKRVSALVPWFPKR
jgi:steroid 5-alpha reductase family enzyme